jgi:hypothetical protein
LSGWLDDARLALRSLLRQPAHTVAVVLILAAAVGSQTAMFGVVRAVLLAPLAYPHPERLVSLVGTSPVEGDGPCPCPSSRTSGCAPAVSRPSPLTTSGSR